MMGLLSRSAFVGRLLLLLSVAWAAPAADLKLDLSQFRVDEPPPGFRSAVSGRGKPGDWRVILAEVPPLLSPLTPTAPMVTRKAALAQLAQDPTDEHFPLLIYQGEVFDDFILTTRFKTVRGAQEQMAGIAFRVQDETNFYVVRASTLGSTFRFYKVVNGQRGEMIGPQMEIAGGVWHDLRIECEGNKIELQLDGQQVIPTIHDGTFAKGKIAFWTKSDSVSYFTDTEIKYKPRKASAQALVQVLLKKYPKLLGLRLYVPDKNAQRTRLAASKNEEEIGQEGGETEDEVARKGTPYYSKGKQQISVTMPVRDRNGDIIAVVRVDLKPFTGETAEAALTLAGTIVKDLQGRVQGADDLE